MRTTVIILSCSILACCFSACGGGGGGGSSSNGSSGSENIPLSSGTPVVDNSTASDGYVTITFPDASGDHPIISGVTATGITADGYGDLPDTGNASYDITVDGVVVYFPLAGNYTVTVQVNDSGDSPEDSAPLNINIPTTSQFSISGEIEDGPLGSESGVQTDVTLLWHPVSTPVFEISQDLSSAGTGAFNFNGLTGEVGDFKVLVAGGVK